MYIEQVQYALWALAVIGQITAATLLYKRSLHSRFPAFFAYNAFQVLRSLSLYIVLWLFNHNRILYKSYFTTYWITDALSVALCLLIVYEAFRNFFYEYRLARQIGAFALVIAVIVLLSVNILLLESVRGHESHPVISSILLLDRSAAVVQVGLLLALFICSLVLALPWRTDLSFGIGLGLGIVGTINLIASSVRVHYGRALNDVYAVTKELAYLLAVIIWLVYIRLPRAKIDFSECINCESHDMDAWNETLRDFVHE